MGMHWTEEQQQVIDTRNCNILVAAAAGSGKTAVLVERIITCLTRDEHPLNVDELLIVTFTEAAAAEMKERILIAIEKALEEKPRDAHLQKQATLIHSALITTIHSFCLSVIRDHFHTIDLDPIFRIGEEGELKLLKQDTMNKLLEKAYGVGTDSFINLVECIAPGRSDKKLEELILGIYEFSRSNPQPGKWLDSCAQKYEIQDVNQLEESSIGRYLSHMIAQGLMELSQRVEGAIAICLEEGGPHHYEDALQSDKASIDYMIQRMEESKEAGNEFQTAYTVLSGHVWEPLSRKRPKDVDPDKKQLVQDIRNSNKKVLDGWRDKYFYSTPESQISALQINCELIQELVCLVKEFGKLYEEEKQGRGMIDFNDMEQYALRILTSVEDGEVVPSKVAAEYQDKFAEVMIDEYQDSNLVQEAILTSVSKVSRGTYNIFMVGDVKQSIYRFRLSRPELFMEKFNTYKNQDDKECRIDLNKNFRSRDEVLASTNHVFYQIMKASLGGVAYDAKSALYCGASFPDREETEEQTDNKTELLLLDEKAVKNYEDVEENSRELEARMVGRRIKNLVGKHAVYDSHMGGYRPAKYSDIVILSRSLSGWSDVFSKGLGEEGVPTSVENKEGYFSTLEVALLLDYLRVLDNPKQDIPLTAVLRSMFGSITDGELAVIKGAYRNLSFCEAVYAYAGLSWHSKSQKEEKVVEACASEEAVEDVAGCTSEEDVEDAQLQEKLRVCLERLESFRKKVVFMGIHELLWEILQETHYLEYVYALPGGEQRRANIEMLLEKATAFEGTSYKGIFNFIRYIEQLEKYQVEYGEANMVDELEDAVRIMSIHKSKGLEFPIVFIVGMGKLFNKRDQADAIVMHLDEGIGIDTISATKRIKFKSLMKQGIKKRLDDESLGEELRVLYVAMTRAKEKLIMTGKVTDLEKKLGQLRTQVEVDTRKTEVGYLDLSSARSYLDWVLPCVYLQEEGRTRVEAVNIEELIRQEVQEEVDGQISKWNLEQLQVSETYNERFKSDLEAQFAFEYDYQKEQEFKLKMSVTEIKQRASLRTVQETIEEYEEGTTLEEVQTKKPYAPFVSREPQFIKNLKADREKTPIEKGAFRGTSYHKFLELWEFTEEYSEELLALRLAEYERQKKMSAEMVACIEHPVVREFMEQPIAKRMKEAAKQGRFHKEQPFVLGVKASQIYGIESTETILVQGIIDAYFEEEDGIVVLDYKTDKVKSLEKLQEKYQAQLDYYGQALEQLTGKKVTEKVIYSLFLQDSIALL